MLIKEATTMFTSKMQCVVFTSKKQCVAELGCHFSSEGSLSSGQLHDDSDIAIVKWLKHSIMNGCDIIINKLRRTKSCWRCCSGQQYF